MHFYPTERMALFIDGANLYATAKALGFDIDYKRLLALFRTKGQLVRAQYYTALAEDQEYSSIRPLVDWLDYNGYMMVTKPTKEFTDSFASTWPTLRTRSAAIPPRAQCASRATPPSAWGLAGR
jgi:uncharacterized LabA/DUF88 family protein